VRTPVCELLGIDFPLLAFSHCRDVVAAVTSAGGFGVLGAMRYDADELEVELRWIDEQVRGRPYGLDVIVPQSFEGKGEHLDAEAMAARIPDEHWAFLERLLAEHGLAGIWDREAAIRSSRAAGLFSDAGIDALLEVVFSHPVRLVANALGPAPARLIESALEHGVACAGLVGAPEHAVRQLEAGVDVVVASGYEAGGHTGEIGTMVLVPEVIAAVEGKVPVLAAGGIVTGRQMAAAIALGAAGVWTGSVWLTTHEAETSVFMREKILDATSRDVIRSRARTGKPARQLRTAWHDAWEGPDSPGALPMPLMSMIGGDVLLRIEEAAEAGHEGARELASYYAGQGVGLMREAKSAATVVETFMEDFADAYDAVRGAVEEEDVTR
jgi:NAD(P)H-dependent flavin oxidoreductase YrpB (nitropropane dioxygenase family)